MSAPRPVLGVGVLGAGTVGSQVIRIARSSSAMWMLPETLRLIVSC